MVKIDKVKTNDNMNLIPKLSINKNKTIIDFDGILFT
jgi:hypothetical protein